MITLALLFAQAQGTSWPEAFMTVGALFAFGFIIWVINR